MITQEYLKECLEYNSETGVFTWRHRSNVSRKWNTRHAGKIAGTSHNEGYISIRINGKPYLAHRLAWIYVFKKLPEHQIDHINNIRNDNRIINLREATVSENGQNRHRPQSNNVTGFLGVHLHKKSGRFQSGIRIKGKRINLGYFLTKEEAHEAYLKAKRALHPFCTI